MRELNSTVEASFARSMPNEQGRADCSFGKGAVWVGAISMVLVTIEPFIGRDEQS